MILRAVLAGSIALTLCSCAASNDATNAARNGNGARPAPVAAAVGGAQDTVVPAGPAGEPATSFPAPSRTVASIVAPRWTNEDDRDDAGEFARVARLARIERGSRVADIGAGDGYYVVRLAGIVGPMGMVYGEDIMPDYLRLLQARVRSEKLANVRLSRGDAHDPRLPTGEIDVALMIHMYHEIDQPFGLLYNLAPALRANGRLVILDLERPTFGHGTPPSLLRCELAAVGYRQLSFTKTGTEEYVAIFEAPATDKRPTPADIRNTLAATPCRAPA